MLGSTHRYMKIVGTSSAIARRCDIRPLDRMSTSSGGGMLSSLGRSLPSSIAASLVLLLNIIVVVVLTLCGVRGSIAGRPGAWSPIEAKAVRA